MLYFTARERCRVTVKQWLPAVAPLCLLQLVACNQKPESSHEDSATKQGQKDIELLLLDIKSETNEKNTYIGDSYARSLRKKLETIEPENEPGSYLQTLSQLGDAEINLGNLDAGIDRLHEAYAFMDSLNVKDSARAHVTAKLAYAYLRLAETENCCALHSPESCIVPLKGAAIHTARRGSESAVKYFNEVLALKGADNQLKIKCAWLLNLAYMTLGEYPDSVPKGILIPTKTFTSEIQFPAFVNVGGELGIDQFDLSGGAAWDDFDGDNDFDLITSSWDPAEALSYFENHGAGKLQERTAEAGLSKQLGGLNLVQADYDNDGDIDLYVMRGAWLGEHGKHPNSLLQNQGNGTFIDRTFESGLGEEFFPSQTAAWADYDNDGDLDLYVGNETDSRISAPCQLFQNQGDGTFVDVAAESGVTNDRFTKGVAWGDIDGDRWPDIVVSNLGGKNRLYHNQGDGTFVDIANEAGIEYPMRSFPVWTWDYDNDGLLDIFISSYNSTVSDFVRHYLDRLPDARNRDFSGHFKGNGRGQFENMAIAQGLGGPMLAMGANYGDLNNDGYLDFYLGTGDPSISTLLPNMMFLNDSGEQFTDVTMAGGFGHLQKGHAISFVDYDGDGDQDVFEQMGGARPVDKYRNALFENPGFGNHWLQIKLVGTTSNRSGIGARIKVTVEEDGVQRDIYRHVGSGGSFGANPLTQHIGIGKATEVMRLEIFWPTSNTTQEFQDVAADQMFKITEGEDDFRAIPSKSE